MRLNCAELSSQNPL